VNYFTVNGGPAGDDEMLASIGPSRMPGTPKRGGWISQLLRTFRQLVGGERPQPITYNNQQSVREMRASEFTSLFRSPSVAFARRGSPPPLGTAEIRCSGGATSGNPDADIDIFVEIWLEGGGRVGFAQARGYTPSAQAVASVQTVSYDRWIACYIYAGTATAQATGTLLADCGDDRTNMREEYRAGQVAWTPECTDFTQSVPTVSHYSFDEWNSGTYSWAVLRDTVTGNLYCVVSNYGSTPGFNSGYRNPAHNAAVGGAQNSRHVYGDAADLDTPTSPNDALYDALRQLAKNGACGVACVEPRGMSPSHFHADYRGACPAGW